MRPPEKFAPLPQPLLRCELLSTSSLRCKSPTVLRCQSPTVLHCRSPSVLRYEFISVLRYEFVSVLRSVLRCKLLAVLLLVLLHPLVAPLSSSVSALDVSERGVRDAVDAVDRQCPSGCSCLDSTVECRGVSPVLQLPDWTRVLLLTSVHPSPSVDDLTSVPLRELVLSKCGYKKVPQLGRVAQQLRKLTVSNDDIDSLAGVADSLGNATQLEELSLEHNLIARVGGSSDEHRLPALPALRTLRLSGNRIKQLEAGAFSALPGLVDLRLNRNRINHLPRKLFAGHQSLENLDVSKNQLSEFEGLLFKDLTRLVTLKLRHNKIIVLKDGSFYGLSSLVELRLDYNVISTVTKGCIYGLDSLKVLSISHNRLASLGAGCWEYSRSLEELDLSGNYLVSLNESSFEHLDDLKRLKLSRNKISSISENTFSHLTKLETLDLSNNKISWTVEDMNAPFSGLRRLRSFTLAYNHIKSIGDRAFYGLESLTTLNVNGNNITSLQERAFVPLQSLHSLHLNTSSLLCDCDLIWLSGWLSRLSHKDNVKVVCAYPLRLRGKYLLSLDRGNLTCDDSPKPKIYEHPATKLAIKGEATSLSCVAVSSSSSRLEFIWRRNDVNISNPEIKESIIETNDDTMRVVSELVLRNVSDSDSGKYQCIVSNSYGTTYSNKSHVTIVIFPKFSKIPANITVNAKETAKLECAADGDPMPQIAWRKDGGNDFFAARERRMHVMPTDDVFFIINTKASDTGVYSCTAQNIAGTIVSNATLTVLEPPSFVSAMESKEIVAGESVVLQCMVSGSPKPALRWLKDGAPIMPTERHFFTAEDQLLIIVGAIPSDEGTYECEITNYLGTVRDSAELRVLPPVVTSTQSSDEDMMGIIIITVVCCAVATSIVWVFIIYHTKKRMNSALPQFSPDSPQLAPLSTDIELMNQQLYSGDSVSERSSCKDSGTGDSAKRSSLEVNPSDELQQVGGINAVPLSFVNSSRAADESRSLLRRDDNMKAFYSDDCEHSITVQMHAPDEILDENNLSRTYPYS